MAKSTDVSRDRVNSRAVRYSPEYFASTPKRSDKSLLESSNETEEQNEEDVTGLTTRVIFLESFISLILIDNVKALELIEDHVNILQYISKFFLTQKLTKQVLIAIFNPIIIITSNRREIAGMN